MDRSWIEEECGIGVGVVPGENPPAADNVFVALVELDQDRGSTSQPHPEIVVMDRNPLSCGSAGCSFSVYAVGSEGRRRIGGFDGSELSFGAGYHNGMRDVILDSAGLFTFDGAEYGWARRLPEVPYWAALRGIHRRSVGAIPAGIFGDGFRVLMRRRDVTHTLQRRRRTAM